MGQAVNDYYRHNAYGRVDFDFAWVPGEAASARGWTLMGASFAQYADGLSLGAAALRQALATADLPHDLYAERAVVVYAGQGQRADPASPLYPAAIRLPEGHTIEIQGPSHLTRLHVPTLVLLSEHDELGTWVHELGHTLYARQSTFGGFKRLSNRYDDRLGGQIGFWDLMGYGSRWGIRLAHRPRTCPPSPRSRRAGCATRTPSRTRPTSLAPWSPKGWETPCSRWTIPCSKTPLLLHHRGARPRRALWRRQDGDRHLLCSPETGRPIMPWSTSWACDTALLTARVWIRSR